MRGEKKVGLALQISVVVCRFEDPDLSVPPLAGLAKFDLHPLQSARIYKFLLS
jgi:hypothetical protein